MKLALTLVALIATSAIADSTTRGYPLLDRRDQTSLPRVVERVNEALEAIDDDAGSGGTALVTETNRAQVAEALLTPKTAVFDTVTIADAQDGVLTNAVTITCKDAGGATLAAARSFQMWFTTVDAPTVITNDNVASVTYSAGAVAAVGGSPGAEVNTVTAAASGLTAFDVVATAATTTNMVYVLTPNGKLVSETLIFTAE